jgi:hypothetical protein
MHMFQINKDLKHMVVAYPSGQANFDLDFGQASFFLLSDRRWLQHFSIGG